MKNDTVIKVDNLSKKFCRNLRRSMYYGIQDLGKNLLGIKPNTTYLKKDEFWALDDVSFELKKGETLGIIGLNGSGKTTLLRILNGIFPPDKGRTVIKGKIGGLIAVGAGFHPHMTGRENVYLNGTILGLSKSEIKDKFNDIVTFAEIGDFLDAPVSTYSSGMRVRLGFAIAIHCEPEVLLIDEVLAVGDLSFKNKCMKKLDELKKTASTIFISHDMNQVSRICDRVMLLDKGKILAVGEAEEIIVQYSNLAINNEKSQIGSNVQILDSTGDLDKLIVKISDANNNEKTNFTCDDDIRFTISFTSKISIKKPAIGFVLVNSQGIQVAGSNNKNTAVKNINKGENSFVYNINKIQFLSGTYKLYIKWKTSNNASLIIAYSQAFSIVNKKDICFKYYGLTKINDSWEKIK